jgi:hypothetical protein
MLCPANFCGCGIVSASLVVTGSGAQGDPYKIESTAFAVVTSSTRPGAPFVGQSIYETDTKRYLVWDGTFWVIMAGQFPGCSAFITTGSQSLTTATTTTLNLATESYNIGGLHAGTNGFFTIPTGMAGDYTFAGWFRCASNVVGQRTIIPVISSNGSQVNSLLRSTTFPDEATTNSGVSASGTLRLVAGAIVTLQGYQTSGGNLICTDAMMSLDMIRHIPSLT